ncbi:MAG: transaldolase family protein [Chloroflexota bacterium]
MATGYFRRVHTETQTRFWINLPTDAETVQAIAAGAVSCTTNPTHCARMIDLEPEYMRGLIDSVVREVDDDVAAAERVYQLASLRIADRFAPVFKSSGGKDGYVTIQGNTNFDEDADYVIREALRHTQLAPNVMAKIPTMEGGLQVVEELAARNVPICATEIFTVSQAIEVCEAYKRGVERGGNHPPLYVTHITGIFDRYISEYARKQGIDIAPEVLAQAGWAVAHEEYRILKERGFEGQMLGGGASQDSDFTQMVGGDMHVTLNWNIVQSLLEADLPVANRIDVPAPREVVAELSEKLPAFREAYYEGAIAPVQYKDHGPLIMFRNMFLAGYNRLLAEVAARRAAIGQQSHNSRRRPSAPAGARSAHFPPNP